jgi:hypothetical protein
LVCSHESGFRSMAAALQEARHQAVR